MSFNNNLKMIKSPCSDSNQLEVSKVLSPNDLITVLQSNARGYLVRKSFKNSFRYIRLLFN